MDEEQKRAADLARNEMAKTLGHLLLDNIELKATLQAQREAMLKRAAEQK